MYRLRMWLPSSYVRNSPSNMLYQLPISVQFPCNSVLWNGMGDEGTHTWKQLHSWKIIGDGRAWANLSWHICLRDLMVCEEEVHGVYCAWAAEHKQDCRSIIFTVHQRQINHKIWWWDKIHGWEEIIGQNISTQTIVLKMGILLCQGVGPSLLPRLKCLNNWMNIHSSQMMKPNDSGDARLFFEHQKQVKLPK